MAKLLNDVNPVPVAEVVVAVVETAFVQVPTSYFLMTIEPAVGEPT